jgi:pimeloyl-ACP methyl ester carboxylesterase
MRSIFESAAAGSPAGTRMIWIPGAYHDAQSFIDQGFAASAAVRHAPLDLCFVDLEMTHLQDANPLQKLRSEIILPARAAGQAVWLAGISLGGLLALDYASTQRGEIDGLCLLAPYLGNRMLVDEIAAGGLADSDAEHRIWRYIKTPIDAVPVYLGYGRQDRFSKAHDLMAAALPAARVDAIEGGHDWGTWLKLWERFLDLHFT